MTNLHKQFKKFEEKISITSTQERNIVNRHKIIREIITLYFKDKPEFKTPDFLIQGSYKMKTMVQKKDGSYDVDLGVYFKDKPNVKCTTVQKYIVDAVKSQTAEGAQHLKKCIRLIYSGEFNIDLPVYYQGSNDSLAWIAIKDGEWRKDDPEEFIKWFEKKRKEKENNQDGQMLRVVKYLKRWANLTSFKTPSGMALTVWVGNFFIAVKDRDDEALYKTIKNIADNNVFWLTCSCPVEPEDDLLSNLDSSQKDKFKIALKSFRDDALKALQSNSEVEAMKLFSKHLGNKFNT